jgi:hypothetical protein
MRTSAILALIVATVMTHGSTRADDASEAQLQYELGVELYKQRRFAEAVERFVASNRLVPNGNVVLNIAQTYELMGRPVAAYNWYETCLVTFALEAEQRRRAEDARDALGPKVSIAHVRTQPAGASIYVDRVDLGSVGTAPRRVAVEPGAHEIIVRLDGHHDARTGVELKMGQLQTVAFTLEPVVGVLRVETSPPGATIRLEGVEAPLGRTPLEATLPVGRHELVLGLDGHVTQRRTVRVQSEEATALALNLPRDASRFAVLSVLGTPLGATVRLDGKPVGDVPLTLEAIEPGRRRIEVEAPERKPWSSPLVLEAGSATRVKVDLAKERGGPWAGWRWMGYGGGGGMVLTGAALGISARIQRNRFFDTDNPTRSHLDAVHRRNVAADVLLITGLAALTATVLWELLRKPAAESTGDVHIDR